MWGLKIRKILIYFLFLIIALIHVSAMINEVMYNPDGNDNNKEFIELYSEEPIDLSDFIIGDLDSNDTLEILQYYDSDYYLITEEGFNLSGIEASVFSAGATIGNNLNTEDSIFLYHNNGTIIDSLSYTDDCESGYSLEYSNGSFYCSFYLGGTPGKENSIRNQDYSQIIINEFFPDPAGDDNAPMPDGEFIEIYNNGDNATDLVGSYFKDSAAHKLYITGTTTIGGTIIQSKGYLAVYTNGFSGLLNNDGFEEISLYDPYGNLIDKVSYAGSQESLSWSLVSGIWHYRYPTPNEKNPSKEVEMGSSFQIQGLEDVGEDNETEFGDIIKVKFYVYKGNTTKNVIKLYIENDEDRITKITKAELNDKFTNYSLTLPIPLYSNCNEKYDDGEYYVKLGSYSSSEAEDSFNLKVKGINMDNCDKIYVESKPRKGTLGYKLIESPVTIEPNKGFIVKTSLTNNDGVDHLVDVYSYVYKGPKCYSSSREANKKRVLVEAGTTKEVELENMIAQAEQGEYNLKVKIKRDDQKTEKEITETIQVLQPQPREITETIGTSVQNKNQDIELKEEKEILSTLLEITRPKLIYESPTEKAKKLVVYFFMALLIIYSAILTWKR